MARTITTQRPPESSARSRPRARRSGPRGAARSSTRRARSTRPRRDPRQADVQAFLERYTVCLTSGDGQGAAACFELPSVLVMGDPSAGPSQVLQDEQTVADFFGNAPAMYHEKGIESTIPEIEHMEWVDDDIGLVQVRFPYIDAEGNDLGDGETSLYVLRAAGDDYRIVAAVALGTDSDRQARRKRPRGGAGDVGDQLTDVS